MPMSKTATAVRRGLVPGLFALGLAACGGSSGGGGSSSDDDGTLSLGITDAPVDNAEKVVVEFSSVTLKPADGEPNEIELDEPNSVDLLEQQNGNSELLLDEVEVAAGEYDWIRLGVNAGPNATFITIDGNQSELDVPSGQNTGLKLVSGFTVTQGNPADLTIDFDLRKSIIETGNGNFKLRPALRLIDNTEAGEIAMTATNTFISDNQCGENSDKHGVYVFTGADVEPSDVNVNDEEGVDPVTTVPLTLDEEETDTYTATAAFLEPGTYTVAYTCNAEDDDPEADDNLNFSEVTNVEVEADGTATYDLPLESEQ